MRIAYLVLVASVACSGDIISYDREVNSGDHEASLANITTAVGNAGSGAMKQQAQNTLPAEHEKITFSTYAEVTAADIVEVVLLLDSKLADEQKKQLAGSSDALLKHIINSHWKIAAANLNTTTYPTSFITKYVNHTDYDKQFATAITSATTPVVAQPIGTGQVPSAGQVPGDWAQQEAWQQAWQRGTLRVFIIITPQSFADTNLDKNDMIVAEEHAHRTKVYALINTADNKEGFINWKNDKDKHVLSRYASLASNNNKALAEFSADIAHALRGMFAIPPPHPQAIPPSDNYAIAQMKVFNAPEGEKEQDGFIHDSHYQVKQNFIFTRAQFSEGVCVDVTLQP